MSEVFLDGVEEGAPMTKPTRRDLLSRRRLLLAGAGLLTAGALCRKLSTPGLLTPRPSAVG